MNHCTEWCTTEAKLLCTVTVQYKGHRRIGCIFRHSSALIDNVQKRVLFRLQSISFSSQIWQLNRSVKTGFLISLTSQVGHKEVANEGGEEEQNIEI